MDPYLVIGAGLIIEALILLWRKPWAFDNIYTRRERGERLTAWLHEK